MFRHVYVIIPLHSEPLFTQLAPVAVISRMFLVVLFQTRFTLECFVTSGAMIFPSKGIEHSKDVITGLDLFLGRTSFNRLHFCDILKVVAPF